MTINLHLPSQLDTLKPKITVIGVGGAGGNAVNNMIASNLEGVDFVMANTDAQALDSALTSRVVQLGATVTRGLGAGASPDVGRAAAEEALADIAEYIQGSNMVFITAGMGGGTGTGAAPVIARLAKEQGMLTVGVVTKPFHFEGTHRMRIADAGIQELHSYVDTLIIIPNQNLFRIANEKTTFAEAFRMADEVLHSGVRGVTDLMVKPGLVNLDFADIRAVMSEMGKAMMGTGEATGDRRALEAAEAAISNPLLDDVSLKGARAVLINITGGPDMTLFEVDEAANRIRDEVDPDANIIFGSTFSDALQGKMRVSVVATGIDAGEVRQRPQLEMTAAAQAARKPFQFPTSQKKAEPSVSVAQPIQPVQQRQPERSPGEIVRQAGAQSVSEIARQAAARVTGQQAPVAQQPMVRIVDEAVQQQEEAYTHMAQANARVDEAMRIASQAKSNFTADAGPLFVTPRAEQPQQRTLFTAQQPQQATFAPVAEHYHEEAALAEDSAEASTGGLFSRLGKALGAGRGEAKLREVTSENPPEQRKAEVRESRPAAAEDEELYDIPAFLRRQAN